MSTICNICLAPVNRLQCSRPLIPKNLSRIVTLTGTANNKLPSVNQRKCYIQSLSNNTIAFNRSSSNFIKSKIDDLVAKYEEITGMDEVRVAQNRVIEAQDKFVLAQEKRRDLVKRLTDIQNKLKEIYAELDATTRGEER